MRHKIRRTGIYIKMTNDKTQIRWWDEAANYISYDLYDFIWWCSYEDDRVSSEDFFCKVVDKCKEIHTST